MEFTCQRCAETLSTEAAFCPHCAAPQLRWIQPDADPRDETDATPPAAQHNSRRMHWRALIRLTLLTSLATGILCSLLSLGTTLLWIVCGTAATITFYRRRHPSFPVDARFGARIGFLFGLLTAAFLTIADAGLLLFQRYVLHQGNKFDQAYANILDQFATRAPTGAAALQQWNALMQFWHLPEARAGLYIISAAVIAVMVIMLSGAAGAIAVRVNAPRNPSRGNA